MITEAVTAITLVVAIWGAITGTVALVLELIRYYSDRPRLQIQWLRNFAMGEIAPGGRMRESDQRIARLVVTNLGRQSIRVIGGYAAHYDNSGGVQLVMFAHGLLDQSKNRVLTPEQPSTEYHVNEGPLLDSFFFIGVNDAYGKTHPLWLVSGSRRRKAQRQMKLKNRKATT